jgi:hypothetical protein
MPYGNKDSQGNPEVQQLAVLLSIRSTDLNNPLTVRSVRYYDGSGHVVREYAAGDKLGPLGTREVFLEHNDQSGGSGAKFIVVWDADKPINAPIIETIHTYFYGTKSVAFSSPGQPVHTDGK